MKTNKDKILWITRTGVLIALLITLQWSTSGLGQYVTGSCVNAVLAIAALAAGLWSGVVVAVLSPFCAFLVGVGPQLIQIVPAIAAGNLVLVLVLYALLRAKSAPVWKQAVSVIVAAFAKFVALYVAVVQVFIPLMGAALKEKQVATFTAMFSWNQLVTALIGCTLAMLIVPVIRKAIKK